ncbi:MAG: phosphodiester glycosidase family protein, partial [Myxococcota bacterium]
FDGALDFVPYHYRSVGLEKPTSIDGWLSHLDVPVVFNAGQFDEDDDHLGWLKGEGEWLSRAYREQWKALLVSAPSEGAAWSGIVDLERSEPDVAERYRNVLQSMMLVDVASGVRVRETDRTACRTVVAQDAQGRMLLVMTEGAVTLAKLGRWLVESDLGVVRAMNLDGGLESQVAMRTDEASMSLYGQYGSGTEVFDAGTGSIRRPLPAVIGVRPR